MKILVLEDNKESRRALTELISQIDDNISVIAASNLEEASGAVANNGNIELFLLDINLNLRDDEDTSGLIFAKKIREYHEYEFTPIVFITSVANLEMVSYRETQCYSYITKPFRRSEVEKIVRKVLNRTETKEEKTIVVKKDGVNYKLRVKDIVSVHAIMRGVCLKLRKEEMDVRYLTIRQMLDKLKEYPEFVQCHRNSIINTTYIENVDYVNRMIMMSGQKTPIEIGVTHKQALKDYI